MRSLERAGLVAGATALFATTTAGVVAAAPAESDVAVRHSSGTIAGRIEGKARVTGIAELRNVCRSFLIADFPRPGGVRRVDIMLTRVQRATKASVACPGDASRCRR
jgi:hypothetical protein